jgi:hypothetical protein
VHVDDVEVIGIVVGYWYLFDQTRQQLNSLLWKHSSADFISTSLHFGRWVILTHPKDTFFFEFILSLIARDSNHFTIQAFTYSPSEALYVN